MLVSRTVRLIRPKETPRFAQVGLKLADFRNYHCYVLLGNPGLGKSTAFKDEVQQVDGAKYITARRFMRIDTENTTSLSEGPIFIDGLDEVRADGNDPRAALDRLLDKLTQLDNPAFRIACRSNGWLEPGDLKELAFHTGSQSIPVLQLDPLSPRNVEEIISDQRNDAGEFIRRAIEHGLGAFLGNPQLLDILIKSVEIDGWPVSPTDAFEKACRALAVERNTEHLDAQRGAAKPSQDDILNEAGKLFALMLIADRAGWGVTGNDDLDALSIGEVNGESRMALMFALNSGLFVGRATLRRPIHRQYAEFLGARYLDSRIRDADCITAGRVLSLLLGCDGIPLSDLLGLSAWLAALNPQVRKRLISVVPVAIAFEGDSSSFSDEERSELFENLEKNIEFTQIAPSRQSLRALAGRQSMSAISELVAKPERSNARQNLALYLLSGFSPGERLTELDSERDALFRIIRDNTWRSDVRSEAIVALDLIYRGKSNHVEQLIRLLGDIQSGRLSDEENNLRGTLLRLLYPQELQPKEVWKNLNVTPVEHKANAFAIFWIGLVGMSGNRQIRELLDSLCANAPVVIPRLANHGREEIVLELLAKGLDLFGDSMAICDIYRWFELVEVDYQMLKLVPKHLRHRYHFGTNPEAERHIRDWLNARQQVQNELIVYGLCQLEPMLGQKLLNTEIGCKFIGPEAPKGFRHWCLQHAAKLWDTKNKIAEELASWAVLPQKGWGPALTDAEIADAADTLPAMQDWNKRRLVAKRNSQSLEARSKKRNAKSTQEFMEKRRAELDAIKEQESELAIGRCTPAILYQLSQEYMDGVAEGGLDLGPIAKLKLRLEYDQSLVNATLSGLRSLLNRDDLPNLDQIAELYENKELSLFTLPFLAGMAEEERLAGDPLDRLDGTGRRRALGFYYVAGLPAIQYSGARGLSELAQLDSRPAWYVRALRNYPRAVADALVAMHNSNVRTKMPPNQYTFAMSQDPTYAMATKLAVPNMFSVFPTRCSRPQVDSLRVVLWAAIAKIGISAKDLSQLIHRRLRRRGMDVAQQAHWLCAGLFVDKENCLPLLEEFLDNGSEIRLRHVFDFFHPGNARLIRLLALEQWQTDELVWLIRMLGKRIERFNWPNQPRFLSQKEMAQHGCEQLLATVIQTLAESKTDEALGALSSLVADPDLRHWKNELATAHEAQSVKWRSKNRTVLSLKDIQTTLAGGPPAHAADLSALVLDRLEGLAELIRNGRASGWRPYWDTAQNEPKCEEDCRDLLLLPLGVMLENYGLDTQAEPLYADDNKADIRVSAGPDLAIPIEIKLNKNPKVWRAIEDQLVPKYTRAPESDGHGIYVVLWFGSKYMKSPPLGEPVPTTPAELKQQLSERLPAELQTKISIVVIDVSLSGRHAKRQSASTKA